MSNFCLTLATFGDFSSIDQNMLQCLIRLSHESRGSEGPMLRVLRLLNVSASLSVIAVTDVSAKVSANSAQMFPKMSPPMFPVAYFASPQY